MNKQQENICLSRLSDAANLLIADFSMHHYLYSGYANDRTFFHGVTNILAYSEHEKILYELQNLIDICKRRNIRDILILTIAPYFTYSRAEQEIFRAEGINFHGLLHSDLPQRAEHIDGANYLQGIFKGFYIFDEECRNDYKILAKSNELKILPHPPRLLRDLAGFDLKKIRRGNKKITLGFLGEVRKNKGFAEAALHLAALPDELKKQIRCVFCGGVRDERQFRIAKDALEKNGVEAKFLCGRITKNYKVMSDNDFEDALLASHIIIFPYNGYAAQYAYSGAFVDGLLSGAVFLATKGSTMGRIIEKHGLGFTYDTGDSEMFEISLRNALHAAAADSLSAARATYLESCFGNDFSIQKYLGIE